MRTRTYGQWPRIKGGTHASPCRDSHRRRALERARGGVVRFVADNWGHWFLANQQMVKAFEFANRAADARKDAGPRYDVKFEWGDGAHADDHLGALLPDVLRWMFRDRLP
ncbi:MAG TPA: hypothetical protein VFO31_03445 [Vicinamibacterales bacterium]|nr:hypothetical protein [Vicinamibacterales bacterium]